jgi:hypothetical protein
MAKSSARRADRAKPSSRPSSKPPAGQFLTNPAGEKRAIILGMDYYLKLLSELNTLRGLVKQGGRAFSVSARKSARR